MDDVTPVVRQPGEAAVLRRIWRLHFWVGLFGMPVLAVLACTGLVILYAEPIQSWLYRDLTTVPHGVAAVPLDAQVATARGHVGVEAMLDAVTPPPGPGRSTRIDFVPAVEGGERNLIQVFVDPHTGRYLGQRTELSGPVGWANQLHRLFGNDGPTVSLPSLGHVIAPASFPDSMVSVGVGNLLMEIAAVWILVLLASGVYLWWPRAIEGAKPLLRVRMSRGGRVSWRDLHAAVGILVSIVLIGYLVSGLSWSRYWGENWRAFSSTVTPPTAVDAPSTVATVGDFDRMGRRIAWATVDDPVYASLPGHLTPARMGWSDIDAIAKSEHMLPGYSIVAPHDDIASGTTRYGSFTVVNAWPQRSSQQRTLSLDQFSGRTLASTGAGHDGGLARLTGWGVNMHMGTQYGLVTRILATAACLGLLTSIVTGAMMWWKRRRPGSLGLPQRDGGTSRATAPRGLAVTIGAAGVVLGVIYPAFGVTLLVVLLAEAALAARRRIASPDAAGGHDGEDLPKLQSTTPAGKNP